MADGGPANALSGPTLSYYMVSSLPQTAQKLTTPNHSANPAQDSLRYGDNTDATCYFRTCSAETDTLTRFDMAGF